jgi:hypothetical protein
MIHQFYRSSSFNQLIEIDLNAKDAILGAGINLTFIIFWQPQVATWGYSYSTPSGLCVLSFFD